MVVLALRVGASVVRMAGVQLFIQGMPSFRGGYYVVLITLPVNDVPEGRVFIEDQQVLQSLIYRDLRLSDPRMLYLIVIRLRGFAVNTLLVILIKRLAAVGIVELYLDLFSIWW